MEARVELDIKVHCARRPIMGKEQRQPLPPEICDYNIRLLALCY